MRISNIERQNNVRTRPNRPNVSELSERVRTAELPPNGLEGSGVNPLSEVSERVSPVQAPQERPESTPFTLPSIATYAGGKGSSGTYQRLINQIPPHERFVSLFLGNCAILRHKRPAATNLACEIDEHIYRTWKEEGPAWLDLRCTDGIEHLQRARYGRRTFVFADPPYINETLSNGRGLYRHNFTWAQHIELLETLQRTDAMVMLCSLPNLLYENRLTGWRTMQYSNMTRTGPQIEQVWMNYPEPKRLHDYRYLGDDLRERERIKRMQANRLRLLNELPVLERMALLDHLNSNVSKT